MADGTTSPPLRVPSSQVPESVLIWVLTQSFANTVDLVDLFARLVQGAGISAVSHTVIFDFVLGSGGLGSCHLTSYPSLSTLCSFLERGPFLACKSLTWSRCRALVVCMVPLYNLENGTSSRGAKWAGF
jgi:hypothetical protein